MTETKLTPQKAEQAHRILEELANGDTTHAIVHHEADFFPAYLVTLTRAEASIKPSSDMGMCLNRDEIDHFLANKFYWPIKIRIARHIGNCPRCYRYFLDVEGKTFELPEEKGG